MLISCKRKSLLLFRELLSVQSLPAFYIDIINLENQLLIFSNRCNIQSFEYAYIMQQWNDARKKVVLTD